MSPEGPAGLTAMTTMTTPQTFTVGEGDDLITYDVRGDLSAGTPLFMFASPSGEPTVVAEAAARLRELLA